MTAVVVVLASLTALLLVGGHRGLSEGANTEVANGAVAIAMATIVGCVLAVMFYMETFG